MSRVSRPADFEPLASSDPVPGDPDEIAALGKRYADTAAEISRQAASLRKLATATPAGWKGKAGSAFHSHAADLATRISQAHDRYAAAGAALTACSDPMDSAQQSAWAAVWQAKAAQQQMAANAPGPPRPAGSKPLTDAQQAQQRAQQHAYDGASDSLTAATRQFHDAVADYQHAASTAARQISGAIDSDGLKDSWWDRNFGTIKGIFKIIAIVVLVVAAISILLAMPLFAGPLAGVLTAFMSEAAAATALGVAGTTANAILLGGTALQAAFDGTAAATGKGSWLDFGLDILSMATFGYGKASEKIVESLAESAEGTAETVAAGRAGRAAMSSRGLPGIVYSIGSRSEAASKVIRLLGQGSKLDASLQAAEEARSAVETAVKDVKPGNLAAAFTMSGKLATSLKKLSILSTEVPGVVRIEVPKAVAEVVEATDGVAQWTNLGVGTANTVHHMVEGDPLPGEIRQTAAQFRHMLSQVP